MVRGCFNMGYIALIHCEEEVKILNHVRKFKFRACTEFESISDLKC